MSTIGKFRRNLTVEAKLRARTIQRATAVTSAEQVAHAAAQVKAQKRSTGAATASPEAVKPAKASKVARKGKEST